jgi:hypothetical protein
MDALTWADEAVKDFGVAAACVSDAGRGIDLERVKLDSMPASQVLQAATQGATDARALHDQIAPRAEKLQSAWESAFVASMRGDRSRIARQRGVPDWWDGQGGANSLAIIRSGATARTWRYDDESTGCRVVYTFTGSALVSKSKSAPACR